MSRSKRYDPDEDDEVPVRDTDRREARRLKRLEREAEPAKEKSRGDYRSER
jgi:hypothetical protein